MAKADLKTRAVTGRKTVVGAVARCLVLALAASVLWAAAYRLIPPPVTILMVQRLAEGRGLDHRWVSLDHISPAMVRAVIASEDSRFCAHHGFDVQAIEAALRHNERLHKGVRGASTISQQTAKNVFLWPQRSWLRKGLEAWFTVLIEVLWGKPRIMEVYLNTIEMGSGVYGVEAAARHDFGKSAAALNAAEAARLAAILPDPIVWNRLTPRVARRMNRIGRSAGEVQRDDLAGCVLHSEADLRARRGGVRRP